MTQTSIFRPNRGMVRLLAVLCTALLLSACATPVKKTESIEDRVNARWAALFSGDIETAYGYLTPGYRSSVSLQQYKRAYENQDVKWTSAKYIDSTCEENTCEVKLLIGFKVYGAVPGVKTFSASDNITETWIRVDGQWFMVPPR